MAIQGGVPVAHEVVFPSGAFVVGEVTAVEDFDAARAARETGRAADVQSRDKTNGLRLWQVRVVDADDAARKGQTEVVVKVAAEHQPVPPEALPGLPFRPVEFVGLTATPWVDTSRTRPRLAWSFKASGMRSPSPTATARPAAGSSSAEGRAA